MKKHRLELLDAEMFVIVFVQEGEDNIDHVLADVTVGHPTSNAGEK